MILDNPSPLTCARAIRRAAQRLAELTGDASWCDVAADLDGIETDDEAREALEKVFQLCV